MSAMGHLPADNSHVSKFDRADMIEQYGGIVDAQIVKSSIMRQFVDMPLLTGTDTRTVRRMGDTVLQGIRDAEAGQEMAAAPREWDRVQVSVDTTIYARDVRALLNEIQTDFNARRKIGQDHGKTIAKFFDAALLSMGVKASLKTVTNGVASGLQGIQGRDLGEAFKSGYNTELTTNGDDLDPKKLFEKLNSVVVQMQENDVDTDELGLFLRPVHYNVLVNHEKLINRDFSKDNGDFADGTIKTLDGVPIIRTARLADTTVDLSILSNNNEYVPSAKEYDCVGLFMHPESLLGAEAIPLTSNIHWQPLRFAWYIDSYLSFAAAPRRPDLTGAVFKKQQ